MNARKRGLCALIACIAAACALSWSAPALADDASTSSLGEAQATSAPEVFETKMAPWEFASFAGEEHALTAYDQAYRVGYTEKQVAVTNGNWGQNVREHIADDTDDFWEPGNNTNAEKISITITFEKPEKFQWVVYGSRLDAGLKGFPTEFELAISGSGKGEGATDWTTVTHGTGSATSSLCAFDACPEGSELEARRVRFTFKQSLQSYPSCRALRFYREDPAEHVLDGIWANYNHTTLAKDVTLESVQARIAEVRDNPSYPAIYTHIYQPELERVKAAAEGLLTPNERLEISNEAHTPDGERSTRALVRAGDVASYARSILKFSNNTTNRQVTGVWYPADEVARIWVERENPDDPLPIVRWAQPYGYWASWQGGATQLVEGLNLVKVPNYKTVDYKTYDIVAGCAAYLENPYTADEQDGLVRVYFEGGRTFPVYRLGDDIDAYMAELRAHADRVRADHTSEMDVTEIVSNHVMMTVQATRADEIYGAHGHNAKEALECWNTTLTRCYAFEGVELNPANEGYDLRNEYLNENYRVSQVWDLGWMFTAGEHIGVYTGGDAQDVLIDPLDSYGQSKIAANWGLIHEWGHSIDIPARTLQETTNNMPAYFESTFTPEFTRNAQDIERAHQMAQPDYVSGTKFAENRFNFMPFWLVESYWPGWWGDVENLYRYQPADSTNGYANGKDQLNKTERLVLYASMAAHYDLRPFYERWGLNMDATDPAFKASSASEAFQTLFATRVAEGKISQRVEGFEGDVADLPLWLLDRGEYAAVTGAEGNREALHIYDGTNGAPVISHVVPATKTVTDEDGSSVTSDVVNVVLEKSADPMHLCYLVESRPKGSQDESAWTSAGSTHGGVFTDERAEAAGGGFEYRVKAVDRSLHESAYSEPKAAEDPGIVARYAEPAPEGQVGETKTFQSLAAALESAAKEQFQVKEIELLGDCYAENLQVKGSVTLKVAADAEGPVTISRTGSGPILDLTGGANLVLEGTSERPLTLDGYFGEGQAPAVRLASAGAKLTARHVTFQNFVNAAEGEAGRGGAIGASVAATTITLSDCTFQGNSANEGGAYASRGTNTLTNCTFTNNTARSRGGALRNFSGGIVTLNGCAFTGNTSVYGGAASLEGATMLAGCTIEHNSAKFGGGLDASLGGRAIALDDREDVPTTIEGNTALAGDALYMAGTKDTAVYVADAVLSGGADEGHRTVQIAQGKLVLNADLNDCDTRWANTFRGMKGDFATNDASAITGIVAEMDESRVIVADGWTQGTLDLEVGEIGRAQAVAEVTGFEDEDFAEHVRLAGRTSVGTLSLGWRGALETEIPGVYVKRGGTVTLEANGGEIISGDIDGYVAGVETFLPTNVKKTGYSFVGWFNNKELEGASVKCVPATAEGNVTYWAKWSKGNYWINYRPNGGKLPASYQDHRSLEETVELVTPTREGFEFLGWYEKSDFSGKPIAEIPANSHEDTTTIYARWTHGRDKGEVKEQVAPTCTTAGHKLVAYKCVDCGEAMGAELVEIPATGHTFGNWSESEEIACQEGSVQHRKCATCGYVEYKGLDTTSAAQHAWGGWSTIKDPTCEGEGLEARECETCHIREERVVKPLGHRFDDAAVVALDSEDGGEEEPTERMVPATCEDDGVREILGTCAVCKKSGLVRSTQTIPAIGHSWGDWEILHEADCATQTGGLRQHTCRTCEETIAEAVPYEHAWEETSRVDVVPTCFSTGEASIHCAKCGAVKDVQTLEMVPHDYVEGACAVCGASEPGYGEGIDSPGSTGENEADDDGANGEISEGTGGDATGGTSDDADNGTSTGSTGTGPATEGDAGTSADPSGKPIVDGPEFTGATRGQQQEPQPTHAKDELPKTGDDTPLLAYAAFGLAGIACLAGGVTLLAKQRRSA